MSCLGSYSQNIDSLKKELKNNSLHDTLKIKVLKELTFYYVYEFPDTAIQLSRQMLFLSNTLNDQRQKIRAYRRLGMAFEKKGLLDSAQIYFDRAMKLRRQTKDEAIVAIGYGDYADLMISKGDYESALIYYDSALYIEKKLNLESKMSSTYNNKGIVFHYIGDVQSAIDNYFRSMEIDEKMADLDKVATTKANIGMLYHKVKELEKATQYLQEAYSYYSIQNPQNTSKMLPVQESLAVIESDKGNYEEAYDSFTDILAIARKLRISGIITSALMNRGLVSARMKEFESAILDYKEAILIAEQTNAIQDLQMGLANLGNIYLSLDSLDHAIELSKRVIDLNKESPSIMEPQMAYSTLYEAYKIKGAFSSALEMYEKLILLRDELTSPPKYKGMIDIEYEYKVKGYTLQLTSIKNDLLIEKRNSKYAKILFSCGFIIFSLILGGIIYRIRKRKQELELSKKAERLVLEFQLAESEMKALRAQMNPHFVFRSLQSIRMFMLKEKIENAEKYLLKFSKLMRMVLENSRYEEIPIKQDREALELYMELESLRLKHPFIYAINIGKEIDQRELCIPPLILQPIIENAIWHGLQYKKAPGRIDIWINKLEEKLICVIEDNGVGRDYFPSTNKFNLGKEKSLGLKITKERLSIRDKSTQGRSSLKIVDLTTVDGKPCGTRVELHVPLAL